MDEPVRAKRANVCHRCLQPVPDTASRCPHCGDPVRKAANVRILLASLGIALFLAMAFISYKLMQGSADTPAASQPKNGMPPEKKPALDR